MRYTSLYARKLPPNKWYDERAQRVGTVMFIAMLKDKDFFRRVLRIALPVALQNLLGTTASMVDTVMLGTQGQLSVAAVGICAQFSTLLFGMYFGFLSGGMIFFAQYWGAKDEKGVCRAYGLVIACIMTIALLFCGVAVFLPSFVMNCYTDKQTIATIGVEYLRIVGWSFPLQALAMSMSALLRSTERVRIPLYASIASLLTNVFLNWVLIFGRFGMPAMGVRGAAIATLVAAAVNVLVLYAHAMTQKYSLLTRIRDHFRWNAAFVRQYFLKCLPVILNEVLYSLGVLVINISIGRQPEEAIAAMAVFRVIEGLVFALYGGLTNASSVIVGKQIGAGEHDEGFRDAKRFAVLCPIVTFAICLIILPLRGPLLGAFGLTGQALDYGMWMLLIYAVAGTARTTNYIMNNMYRAGGETVFGSIVEVCFLLFASVPAVVLTGIVFHLPFPLVFTLIYLDEYTRLLPCFLYLRSGKWVKPVTEEGLSTISAFRAKHHVFTKGAKA